jgi:hypothetical protein
VHGLSLSENFAFLKVVSVVGKSSATLIVYWYIV